MNARKISTDGTPLVSAEISLSFFQLISADEAIEFEPKVIGRAADERGAMVEQWLKDKLWSNTSFDSEESSGRDLESPDPCLITKSLKWLALGRVRILLATVTTEKKFFYIREPDSPPRIQDRK
ncbi:Uncharacterized protein Fot_50941 [Forsythia ovata]|uniref:Uncharacterized protein n=1 Tax=Forsythia ovata TaxID=205694 RepID=A0ABD1PZK5_9LAMI